MEALQATLESEKKTFWHYWVMFLCLFGQVFPTKRLLLHTENVISHRILKLKKKDNYKIHKYPDTDSPTGHVFFIDKKEAKSKHWETVRNRKGNSYFCYKLGDAQKAIELHKKGEILV